MSNNNANQSDGQIVPSDASVGAQIQELITGLAELRQQVESQQEVIVHQQQQLDEQSKTIKRQQDIISRQETEIANLKRQVATITTTTTTTAPASPPTNASSNNSNVRFFLPVVLCFVFAISLIASFVSQPGVAQSKLIINPMGYDPTQFGAFIVPAGTSFTGSTPLNSTKFGLVTSGNPTFTLNALPFFDTGVYASGSGNGVYATSDAAQGYGLYATNTASSGSGSNYAIYGKSTRGTGVGGEGANNAPGVYGLGANGPGVSGQSGTGSGVLATSSNGTPLTITAGATPTAGNRQMGDIYVDINGRIYIWAKDDTLTTANWRKLQFGS